MIDFFFGSFIDMNTATAITPIIKEIIHKRSDSISSDGRSSQTFVICPF